MRRIVLGTTGIETSCLGFGCASLGSRIGAAEGLRALEEAFEAGVTWLDLAPAYGRGEAEAIAGRFLRGRRDRVELATKVGLAPPSFGGLKTAILPLARRAVKALPPLRRALRGSGLGANRRLPLTPDLIRTSLETSLRRLGTDRVELYALHGAPAAALARDDLRRALEDILAAGKARAIGIASDREAAREALRLGPPFGVVQLPLPAPGAAEPVLPAARAAGFGTIVHSVFPFGGAAPALPAPADPALAARLAALAGTEDLPRAMARLRLARAFALAPGGLVLASMVSPRSRAENLLVARSEPDPAAAELLDRLAG